MTKKHKWQELDYWTSQCTKCGCIRVKTTGAFPTYALDGKNYEFSPACDNRFIPVVPEDLKLNFQS